MARRILRAGSETDSGDRILHAVGWVYLITIVILSWFFLSRTYQRVIPSPVSVARTIVYDIGFINILNAIKVTIFNSLLGYVISLVLTLIFVSLAYVNTHFDSFVQALNTFIQSVSVLVWAIVFVMIFGITSRKPPVLVAAAASFPILLTSTYSSVRALDTKFKLLAKLLGASRWEELYYFILPGTIPFIAAASRAAIGIALRISVVAEAFGASGGVGYWLMYSYDFAWSEGVFAWAIILIFLMIFIDLFILRRIEGMTRKWKI